MAKSNNANRSWAGVLLLHKPVGISSARYLDQVKQKLGLISRNVRVGHAGTLDPFASGLLVLLLGRATKLFTFLLNCAKVYLVQMQFHVATNTGDGTGYITATRLARNPSLAAVKQLFASYHQRTYRQRVPAFSAAHHAGQRFYHYARRGITPPARYKSVVINWVRLSAYCAHRNQINFKVSCGSGCYVRQLVVDLCAELHVLGTTIGLVRTRIGPWTLSQATTLERVTLANLIGLSTVLAQLKIVLVMLPTHQVPTVLSGMSLQLNCDRKWVGVTDFEQTFLIIYQRHQQHYKPLTKIY